MINIDTYDNLRRISQIIITYKIDNTVYCALLLIFILCDYQINFIEGVLYLFG